MYVHYVSLGSHDKHLLQPLQKYPCKRIVFIYSKDKESFLKKEEIIKIEENIKNVKKVCFELKLECEFIELNGSEIYENIKKIYEKMKKENELIISNITGGRKSLSIALLYSSLLCKEKVKNIIYVYNDQIIILPKDQDLTDLEKKILSCLKDKDLKIKEISDILDKTVPLISRYISQLEDKGYVIRYFDENNDLKVKRLF